jgi:hypothetical protein
MDFFEAAISQELEKIKRLGTIRVISGTSGDKNEISDKSYRQTVTRGPRFFAFTFLANAPLVARISHHFQLEVPKDCDHEDSLRIRELWRYNHFYARINELLPSPTGALQMRLKIAAEAIVNEALSELLKLAAESPQS